MSTSTFCPKNYSNPYNCWKFRFEAIKEKFRFGAINNNLTSDPIIWLYLPQFRCPKSKASKCDFFRLTWDRQKYNFKVNTILQTLVYSISKETKYKLNLPYNPNIGPRVRTQASLNIKSDNRLIVDTIDHGHY